MLYAVDLTTGEGLITALLASLLAVFTWMAAKFTNAANMEKRIGAQDAKINKLTDENAECKIENTNLKAELQRAIQRIMHLEKYSGIGPGEPLVGVIIADVQGIIKEFSPTLTPLFRWRPMEVIGKSIFLLMPNDVRDVARQHMELYAKALSNRTELDSKKLILTEGLTKSGTRFPITLSLRGWLGGDLVTATIRERDMALPLVSGGAVARKTPDGTPILPETQ